MLRKCLCRVYFSSPMRHLATESSDFHKEVSKFNTLSGEWWKNPKDPLLLMNSLRIPLLKELESALPDSEVQRTVLDVGCGGGYLSEEIAKQAKFAVTGIDPSPEMIRIAERHAERHRDGLAPDSSLSYRTCTISDVEDTHDIVVASEVIEHVPNVEDFIVECVGRVKPDGGIMFTTINRTLMSWTLAIMMAENVMGLVPPGTHQYAKFVRPVEISGVLREHGFHILSETGLSYNPLSRKWDYTSDMSVNYAITAFRSYGNMSFYNRGLAFGAALRKTIFELDRSSCRRLLRTSPVVRMPRQGGGTSGSGKDLSVISCPHCSSRIVVYCRFAGSRRHVKDYHVDSGDIIDSGDSTGSRLDRLYAPAHQESSEEPSFESVKAPPPQEIFTYLDRFVQGQERAKKVLAVSIYNHYKRLRAINNRQDNDVEEIKLDKSNVLMIGPTGCGKTYLFQMVSKLLDVPLVVCDCTSLTQAGYVGEDVETVIVRLWQAAGQNINRTQHGIIVLDELDKLASKKNKSGGKDIGGEGVQQSLLKIIEGTNVTVMDKSKNKAHQIDTTNILFLASGAFVGLDQIIKKRLTAKSLGFGSPVVQQSKTDIDEPLSDEIKEKSRNERLKRIKVTEEQNRLKDHYLQMVEPKDVLDYGVIPELAGRIPVITTLHSLTQEDLMVIAKSKERGVISQLEALLSLNSCELEFTEDALQAIAELAFCKKTGARALKSILETTLLDAMFEIPGSDIDKVTVTKETVLEGVSPIYNYNTSTTSTSDQHV